MQRKRCEVPTSAQGMAVAQLSRGAVASAHQLLKMEAVGSNQKLVVLEEDHQAFGGAAAAPGVGAQGELVGGADW